MLWLDRYRELGGGKTAWERDCLAFFGEVYPYEWEEWTPIIRDLKDGSRERYILEWMLSKYGCESEPPAFRPFLSSVSYFRNKEV